MTAPDRSKVHQLVQDGIGALLELHDLWLEEDSGAQWSSRSDMPAISSSGRSDPTGTVAGFENRESDRDRIGKSIESQVEHLKRAAKRFQPRRTGPCKTEGCAREGISSWEGRCEKCGPWIADCRRRGLGDLDPANESWTWEEQGEDGKTVVRKGSLVEHWNRSAPTFCECPVWCCPERCDRPQEHGRLSEACKKAMQRSSREPPYGRREAS